MFTFKRNIPIILLILFEIAVGILLLINPEAFTTAAIIIFGVICTVIGVIYLLKFLKARRNGDESVLMLVGAVFALVIGLFSVIAAPFVMTLFTFIAVMYAVIMVVSGLVKIQNYVFAKRSHLPVPVITLISVVISCAIGAVILFNPFETAHILWMFVGISILAEAVLDIAALVVSFVSNAHPIDDGYADSEIIS